jgi:phytoene synthase
MDASLDDLVRRVDEDRWLATRFAQPPARARLIAIYAANYEIARTAEMVTEDTLGEIRLQFWRGAIDTLYGAPGATLPNTPLIVALREAVEGASLPREAFDLLIDARLMDFPETPFATWEELDAYVDATAGNIMYLAVKACAPDFDPDETQRSALLAAARAWGLCGLVRAFPYWARARRTFFPKKLMDHTGITASQVFDPKGHGPSAAARAVLDRATRALGDAQRLSSSLPPQAFPAIAYVTLAPRYIEILMRSGLLSGAESRQIGAMTRRIALVTATARGQL